MKRLATLVLIAFLSFGMLFAMDGNLQKIYAIDDPIMDDVRILYIMSGKSLPSATGPWSGAEIMLMMDKLERSRLTPANQDRYDRVLEKLDSDSRMGSFSMSGSINLESYIHTSDSAFFKGWDNWRYTWEDTKPMVSIIGEQLLGMNFYGFFDFTLGVTKTHNPLDGVQVGSSPVWTNIPFLMDNDMKQLDFNFPYRAFVSAGGTNWTLQAGRERLSWGPGRSGNFIIGDHIKYHNTARIAAFDENFKYTFTVLSFPHPQNYYYYGALHQNGFDGQSCYLNGISSFIAHRLEWRFFDDQVGLALTEGVMYMSKDNRIDLIALSPAHLFHNSYTRSLTNSILGLEMDWTPTSGLNVYSQIVVDEMILPGEPIPGKDGESKAEPTAMGYMLGATYNMEAGPGILEFNLETAYTDPYLYLRDADQQIDGNGYRFQKKGDWGINYVVATREMIGAGGNQYFDEQFLGYKYGGDAVVVDFETNWYTDLDFDIGANLFYMAHGTHDQWTVWTRVNEGIPDSSTPSDRHVTENHRDPDANLRNAVEHSLAFSLTGSYDLPYGFSIYGEADVIAIINPGNIRENKPVTDFQLVLGASWKW